MDRRNRVTAEPGLGVKEAAVGRYRFAEAGEARAVFDAFAAFSQAEAFDFTQPRRKMHRSWAQRGETGYWQFVRPEPDRQYALPERYHGPF